ncbi:MAG: NAD-dependent epimerase/dehydratase family protein [Candidatus Obscuribacterales bacterium]|nr:NAD-dependent epimerase/dehydratase family protein [Candidatus Obscuribacterales bacterium]
MEFAASSCATYAPPPDRPLTEEDPLGPLSVYGLTKLMVEDALKALADRLGWQYICLRYFNASGADESAEIGEAHDPEIHLIPLTLRAASGEIESLSIFGTDYSTKDGTCIRDYIHVNDLARAHHLAIQKLEHLKGLHAINLGSGTGASVREIINQAKEITGKEIKALEFPRRTGDGPFAVANISRAGKYLNWAPEYSLNQIISTAWKWEQQRKAVCFSESRI